GIADAAEHLETGGMNRRDFIKKGALLTAAVAADLTIPDFSFASSNPDKIKEALKKIKYNKREIESTTKFGFDLTQLPPGFANCRDRIVSLIYAKEFEGLQKFNEYSTYERLNRKVGIKDKQILWQTVYLEPALHFMSEKMSKSNSFFSSDDNMSKINLPLSYFERGIHNYFSNWHRRHIRNMYTNPKEIETDFLNSIFAAAYMREDLAVKETQNFLQLTSMQEKAKKLTETMNIFKSLPKDKTSCDPENGYNRCLVAAWSSFMYVNNDANGSKNNKITSKGKLMNELIEIPLRTYVPKIRGPPYYNA
nr:hypothetical protein [Candidatus Woesearchaeota archaeon]